MKRAGAVDDRLWLSGALTIEAAYIMIMALLIFGAMIRYCFVSHDRVLSGMVLNEAMELSGHLREEDMEGLSAYGQERLSAVLSQKSFDLSLEEYRDGSMGSISGRDFKREMTDMGFRPHKLMRSLTMMEGLTDE